MNRDKPSQAEKAFERALRAGRVHVGQRAGYIRGWMNAGRIIRKNRGRHV